VQNQDVLYRWIGDIISARTREKSWGSRSAAPAAVKP
jgi:hypothetical protein